MMKGKRQIALVLLSAMLLLVTVILPVIAVDDPDRQVSTDPQILVYTESIVPSEEKFVTDEILVKFKPGVGRDKIDQINSKHGASVRYTSPFSGTRRIAIPRGKDVSEMVKRYQAESEVDYAEPNYIAHAVMVPNDPYYEKYQWHLDNDVYGGIGMEDAWDLSTGTDIIVAVLDTGVAYEDYQEGRKRYYQAPDLAGTSFVAGYDFVNNDAHPNDDHAHGTHVTGTLAQTTNNNLGVAGVAFNARIMPVKVLDESGSGYYSWIEDGIYYATDQGAQVISLSLGGDAHSESLENAVKYAYENGVTVIAAAGNDASSTISYPAAYDDSVIAVGATRYDETLAYYSNYGSSLDFVAPGGDLTLDQNGDGYGDGVLQNTFNPNTRRTNDFGYWFFQGTSMATPHVSGVAALLIANGNADADNDGTTTPDEVRAVLQETAEDLGDPGWDETFGWGLVNAYAALQWTTPLKEVILCDANGNPKDSFCPGEGVYVMAYGLEGSTDYTIWIQIDPVDDSVMLNPEENPDTAETPMLVTTESDGSLSKTLIWQIPLDAAITYAKYDIILDKQDDDFNTGTYNAASDGIASTSVAGGVEPLPELSTILLFSIGLLVLVGYAMVKRKQS
jgi:serine protease